MREFEDRRAAGHQLAKRLKQYGGTAVVLALPRGGVETAVEVAKKLKAPLDLVIARKIGHPGNPEYAVGAVTETGPVIWNKLERATLDKKWLKEAAKAERAEAKRRRQQYMNGRDPVVLDGKTAILVDDGLATGLTMRAAVSEARKQKPASIIVAVPVGSREAVETLSKKADEVITLIDPDYFFGAVGGHYESFPQLTDEDVIELLN